MKNVRLHMSPDPGKPPVETYGDLVIHPTVPYSDNSVTLLINPTVSDFKSIDDRPEIKIRNLAFMEHSANTIKLFLEIGKETEKEVKINGHKYNIKLLFVGKEKFDDGEFPYFDLLVEKL